MIIRSTIESDCEGRLYYTYTSMGKKKKEYLPKYRSRLSEYDAEQLIQKLEKDSTVKTIYLYKVIYSDGRISLLANPNDPIGILQCEDDSE